MTRGRIRIDVDPRTRIEVVPRFETSLRTLLRDPERLAALFAGPSEIGGQARARSEGASATSGRAPLVEIQLRDDGSDEVALARRGHRGGWLAPLLGDRHASPARAFRELALTSELGARGAPVPEAVFAAARRSGVVWRTVFASLRVPDAKDLLVRIREGSLPRVPDAAQARIARSVGRAIRRFHDRGGSHADLHLGNVLARTTTEEPEIWLVDLDRAKLRAAVPVARRTHELMRLLRSLRKHEHSHPRWIAACLDGYCDGDRALRKTLLQCASGEWPRLRRMERRGAASRYRE